MAHETIAQQTIEISVNDTLLSWVEAFLIDRKAQNLTPGTIRYYRQKIKLFTDYCDGQVITRITQITPDIIRRFLLFLEESGHNAGGVHSAYRSLKAFLLWWEGEFEPESWKNPIRKVKAPKVPEEPIDPVELDTIKAMIAVCPTDTFNGLRDKALLLFLLETGVRASELLSLNLSEVDTITGDVLIRQGKGRKPRTVYMEAKTRKAFRVYLRKRADKCSAAWVTDENNRLKYDGLRGILTRRAKAANVAIPSPHDFRRAFALNMLRNGCDLITLSRLMGHQGLQVLKRYLKQANIDLHEGHIIGSPVEKGGL